MWEWVYWKCRVWSHKQSTAVGIHIDCQWCPGKKVGDEKEAPLTLLCSPDCSEGVLKTLVWAGSTMAPLLHAAERGERPSLLKNLYRLPGRQSSPVAQS